MAHQTKYLNIKYQTKFSFLKHYSFGFLFSRNAKKTHRDESVQQTFFFCQKRNASQTLKEAAVKCLSQVILSLIELMRWTFFDLCFIFHVITRWQYFLCRFIVTQRFGAVVFETSALKDVSIFMLSKVAYMCHQKMHFFVSFLHETFPVLLPIATYTRSYHL